MATLSANKNNIAIACGIKAIVLQCGTDNIGMPSHSMSRPRPTILEPPCIQGQHSDIVDEGGKTTGVLSQHKASLGPPATIVLASFSSCNKWLVLCSSNKQLSLWRTEDWSLVSNRILIRSASSVKFVPSGHAIVVADKSGDAYLYSVENPLEKGTLLLGHLSMLLDILVTPDENYLITCDRDEKIRVSNFPNAYSIHSYCLGHKQFVTHINLLPHDVSVLLSSSGDGTIMFWNYKVGKHNHTLNCSEHCCLTNSNRKSDCASSDSQDNFPVKGFTCYKIEEDVSMICALMSGFHGCLIYKVAHKSETIHSSLVQVLNLDSEPWDISLTDARHLWILSQEEKEPIRVFVWANDSIQFTFEPTLLDESVTVGVSYVNERSDLFACISPPGPMTVLYKRKFDNVQEYHLRKKIRQMATSKSLN